MQKLKALFKLTINRKVIFIIVRVVFLVIMVHIVVAVLHGDDLILLVLIVEHVSGLCQLLVAHRNLRVLHVLRSRSNHSIVASVVTRVS